MTGAGQTILCISKKISIYAGFIILFGGLLGNILNILVFTRLKTFRANQCVFYLIVASIVDCSELLISFTSHIAIDAFSYDSTQTSLLWCKLRPSFTELFTLTSLTIVCCAAFDQYLSTSHYARFRQISSLELSQYLTCFVICIWLSHSIPFILFFEIRPSSGCAIYNVGFGLYYSYVYYCILIGLLPVVTSSIFSVLAYRNVRHTIRRQISIVRRRLDRQLTSMVLARVIYLIISTLPSAIYRIYLLNSNTNQTDSITAAIKQLISAITAILFYSNCASSFYIFLISSTRFQRQVKCVLVKKCWRKWRETRIHGNVQPHNRIAPISYMSGITVT